MKFVKAKLKDERMLPLLSPNSRQLKRLCNIITLSLSCYRSGRISDRDAFYLMLVIVMVEQWPFRLVIHSVTHPPYFDGAFTPVRLSYYVMRSAPLPQYVARPLLVFIGFRNSFQNLLSCGALSKSRAENGGNSN